MIPWQHSNTRQTKTCCLQSLKYDLCAHLKYNLISTLCSILSWFSGQSKTHTEMYTEFSPHSPNYQCLSHSNFLCNMMSCILWVDFYFVYFLIILDGLCRWTSCRCCRKLQDVQSHFTSFVWLTHSCGCISQVSLFCVHTCILSAIPVTITIILRCRGGGVSHP